MKIMVMIQSDKIGHGDDGLGKKLMKNYISTLNEMGGDLWRIVLVNNGVKLTVEGSESIEDLKALAENGADILCCGTCLNHFSLSDKRQVGEPTNMVDIVSSMQVADKVISI